MGPNDCKHDEAPLKRAKQAERGECESGKRGCESGERECESGEPGVWEGRESARGGERECESREYGREERAGAGRGSGSARAACQQLPNAQDQR